MMTFWQFQFKKLSRFLRERFGKIYEINRKYAKPRIKTTPAVKFALLTLRFYLFLLIGILVYKFITLIK
jgi:hypothetical protein